MSSPSNDLFATEDVAARELRIALETMRNTDWDSGDGLTNALALIENNAVSLDATGAYLVKGRTKTYQVSDACQCEDFVKRKHTHCYHRAAVHLYKNWQLRLGATSMPHVQTAEDASQTAQEASSAPQVLQDVSVSQKTPQRQAPAEKYLPLPIGRMLRPLHAILADLRRPLPESCLPTMPRKGRNGQTIHIKFLHWYQVQDLLNRYAPGWYGEVIRTDDLKALTITYRLTVLSAEGKTWRDGIGCETREDDTIDYGDRASNALADAIKKASEQFGIGVWLKDNNGIQEKLLDHFTKEQIALMETLASACEKAGLDKQAYMDALQRQAGAQKRKDIPVAMLQEAIACVEAYAAQAKE